mgnify:CR=1 FL=1
MIFDTHAHYDDEAFDEDREQLLASFKENGIDAVTNVAASLSSCKTTLELARNHDFMYAALGVHPSESAELSDEGLKDIETWCTERQDGKVRAIGLSNFYPDRFVDMAECAEIKPAVNQLKTNVFSQQWDAEAEMKPYDTRIMAWAPLAQGDPDLLTNPILTALAERYNKTVQQVALRYLVQRGIIAIPKSTHIERMKQNLDVFDFTLTPEDMESIRPLDKPADFRWSHRNPELVKFLLNYDKQFNPNNK